MEQLSSVVARFCSPKLVRAASRDEANGSRAGKLKREAGGSGEADHLGTADAAASPAFTKVLGLFPAPEARRADGDHAEIPKNGSVQPFAKSRTGIDSNFKLRSRKAKGKLAA
jgi:hypothetical protein